MSVDSVDSLAPTEAERALPAVLDELHQMYAEVGLADVDTHTFA